MKHLTLRGLKPRRTVSPAISLPVARAAYSVKGRQALKGQQAPLVPAAIGRSGNLRRRPPGPRTLPLRQRPWPLSHRPCPPLGNWEPWCPTPR